MQPRLHFFCPVRIYFHPKTRAALAKSYQSLKSISVRRFLKFLSEDFSRRQKKWGALYRTTPQNNENETWFLYTL
jgi:hypothetical protein